MSCGLSQLTQTAEVMVGGWPLGISPDGGETLFLAREDLIGENPDLNLELFRMVVSSGQIVQLTHTSGAGLLDRGASASEDFTRVVFPSDQDLTGQNPDRSDEIFQLDTVRQVLTQLTDAPQQASAPPLATISGDGSTVAIITSQDLTGGNSDASQELFLYDVQTAMFVQVTPDLSQASVPWGASLSRDGNKLAFVVVHSLTGFSELDFYDVRTSSTRLLLAAERLSHPLLSADGSRLFVASDFDPVSLNSDGSGEIFLLQPESTNPTDSLKQLTRFPSGAGPESLAASGDGKRIAFLSSRDLLLWQGSGAQNIYLYNLEDESLSQVTYAASSVARAGELFLSQDGSRMVFGSQGNLTRRNSDQNLETFYAQCAPATSFFVPQIGSGTAGDIGFLTSFVFSNTSGNTSVQIELYDRFGKPLEMRLGESAARSFFNFQIATGTPLLLETTGNGPLKVGYARVETGPGVTGTAVFTGSKASAGINLYEAAVSLTEPLKEFSVVVNTLGSFGTGLAMVNTQFSALSPAQNQEAHITLRLYDESFRLVAKKEMSLAPGRHTAQFVGQMFMDPPDVSEEVREMVGLLTVSSDQPLAVVSLRQNDDPRKSFPAEVPTLTAFPVAPGRPDR
ncbi:MAG: TolB family protein [Acidobacteriota bacterium]